MKDETFTIPHEHEGDVNIQGDINETMRIGQALKIIRLHKNLTQFALSKKIKINRRTIMKIESGDGMNVAREIKMIAIVCKGLEVKEIDAIEVAIKLKKFNKNRTGIFVIFYKKEPYYYIQKGTQIASRKVYFTENAATLGLQRIPKKMAKDSKIVPYAPA